MNKPHSTTKTNSAKVMNKLFIDMYWNWNLQMHGFVVLCSETDQKLFFQV